MKQVVVLSVKAYQDTLTGIFQGLSIEIFSKMDIEGIRKPNQNLDITNWFAGGKDSDFSVMFFAFVADDVANDILDSIEKWNTENDSESPMHAFMVQVERSV